MTITVETKSHSGTPETLQSDTAEQMVGYLWKRSFVHEATPDQYMKAVARRVELDSGKKLRTDTAANFLEDLADAGLVDIEWGK